MNTRTAKKVVAKFTFRPTQYTKDQIEAAYSALGQKPDPNKMEFWEQALERAEDEKRRQEETAKLAQAKNAKKREAAEVAAKARKAEKERRAKVAAEGEAKAKVAADEAAKKAKESLPQKKVVQVGAVEAKIEAGDDGVIGTDDDEVTIQKAGTDLAEKTVAELKALCREHGIKGYSKKNKEGLIDALSGIDDL